MIGSLLSTVGGMLWGVWGEPFATAIGAYEPEDRSYGRWKIPFSPMEQRLYENRDIEISFHKAMMPNKKDWVWYQVWQDPVAQRTTGRRADMIFVHGTGVHSGTLASQCRRYLDAGFRLLVPDLPSHGYSSGLHVYQRKISGYCEGLRAVLHDVAKRDDAEIFPGFRLSKAERRRTFMLGLSFGGLVAFSYALQYPGCNRDEESDQDEIPIDGLVGVGPMIGYSKHVPITMAVRVFAWIMDRVLRGGRFELMVPHKKCVDKDPAVYKSLITMDKRSHQGAFRIGHLYCIDEAMKELVANASAIKIPVYIQMGGEDRVADQEACLKWLRDTSSEDKRYEVYPVCQHVIYKKAKKESDDLAGRITVIEDNVKWMCQRAPAHLARYRRMRSYASDMSSISSGSKASVFDQESFSQDYDSSPFTSNPPTPRTPGSEFSFSFSNSSSMQLDEPVALTTKPAAPAACDSTLVRRKLTYGEVVQPGHRDGWELAEDGDHRLTRPTWDYEESLRPFQLYPHY